MVKETILPPLNGYVEVDINGERVYKNISTGEILGAEKSIEELKVSKRYEMSETCNTTITSGIDVELSAGTEHFSLEETDQINLTAALTMVEQGAPSYPYHADGNLCRLYTADEIKAISAAAMSHKLYHTTYCNHLFNWIERAESIEEVKSIYYGATLPDDLLANMTEILTNAQTV